MRKLVYVLSNGETVDTLTEAKASEMLFHTSLIEIEEPHSKMTEKQKANLKAVKRNPHINSKGEYHRALK